MEDEDESDNVLRNEKLGFNSKSNLRLDFKAHLVRSLCYIFKLLNHSKTTFLDMRKQLSSILSWALISPYGLGCREDGEFKHPRYPLNPGPPAGSVCICQKARPSFTVYYPPLHRPPPPSHSSLLFAGNPQYYVFDPSEDDKTVNKGRGEKRTSIIRVRVKNDNET
jgi:hypothetical protein